MKTTYKIAFRVYTLALVVLFLSVGSLTANENKTSKIHPEIKIEKELDIKLENWMMDLSEWKVEVSESNELVEPEIEVEEWMLNAGYDKLNKKSTFSEVETEEEIEIEDWMINPAKW